MDFRGGLTSWLLLFFLIFQLNGRAQKKCDTDFMFGDTCLENLIHPCVANNKLILCGELHYFNNNWLVKSTLAKSLNSNFGITGIFIEYPVSYENLYNNYLLYGDDRILGILKYLTLDSLNEKAFLQDLRVYNISKPDSLKLHVICTDMEKNFSVAVQELLHIANHYNFLKIRATKKLLTRFCQVTSGTTNEVKDMVSVLRKDFLGKRKFFRKKMSPSDYSRYDKIIDGLNLGFMFEYNMNTEGTNEVSFSKRELFLADNIKEVITANPEDRYFGVFGLSHCLLNNVSMPFWGITTTPMAYTLYNDSSSVSFQSVCVIAQYYTQYDDSLYLNTFLSPSDRNNINCTSQMFTAFQVTPSSSAKFNNRFYFGQIIVVNRNTRS